MAQPFNLGAGINGNQHSRNWNTEATYLPYRPGVQTGGRGHIYDAEGQHTDTSSREGPYNRNPPDQTRESSSDEYGYDEPQDEKEVNDNMAIQAASPTSRRVIHRVSRIGFEESLSNRNINDMAVTRILRDLSATTDEEICQTYENGELLTDWDKDAEIVDIAIHYIQGSNLADVIRIENSESSNQAPIEKPPSWLALTAGNLLKEPEVQQNLSIKWIDITEQVLKAHRENARSKPGNSSLNNILRSSPDNKVNINSSHVSIVNAVSDTNSYDHLSHCIELDGNSLISLIYNFRDLLTRNGRHAHLSPEQTTNVLGTMVEDARRLLVRSPILSRVNPRIVIQKSKNTRYGVDTGTRFDTFTTSKGIAEIIRQGLAYYSTLKLPDPEAQEAMRRIRPKLMQMVVLLLALVNDDDLEKVRPELEKQYDLKADRQSLEMTIMKVLTLSAVSPWQFMTAVLSNFKMSRQEIGDSEKAKAEAWDAFLTEIARHGWILPGTSEQLIDNHPHYQKKGSWKVKWDGYHTTDVFDQLQFAGEKNAVNSIPPLKTQGSELGSVQVMADFCNNRSYLLAAKDLDEITMGRPGLYTLTDPQSKQRVDLKVDPSEMFSDIQDAAHDLLIICNEVNSRSLDTDDIPERTLSRLSRLPGYRRREPQRASRRVRQNFELPKTSGLRTRLVLTIQGAPPQRAEELAVYWMLDGKRISFSAMLESVVADLRGLGQLTRALRGWGARQSSRDELRRPLLHDMGVQLDKVQKMLDRSDMARQQLLSQQEKNDEPILRVHFEQHIHYTQELPWRHYEQGSDVGQGFQLAIDSERHVVNGQPTWTGDICRLCLGDGSIEATVTPLATVADEDKEIEVCEQDTVLLLGSLVAVISVQKPGHGNVNCPEQIVNFLKLTSLHQTLTSRGMTPAERRERRRNASSLVGRVNLQRTFLD
jgi:hypothetical protein